MEGPQIRSLIDGDLIIFRSAFSAENDPPEVAVSRAKVTMDRILAETVADSYFVWLSDRRTNNYRSLIDSTYKANRTKPPPIHYGVVRDYLENKWGAATALGQEADDALGIEQTTNLGKQETCIVSIDKDMLQIEGKHYNFVKQEWTEVTYQQGIAHFYQQLLTGDRTDNIFSGLKGIGVGRAQAALAYCEDEKEMFSTVRDLYQNDDKLLSNGRLLWIRRKENEHWEFPK